MADDNPSPPNASILPEPLIILDTILTSANQAFSAIYGLNKFVFSMNEAGKGIYNAINTLSKIPPPKL